ncbi:MAG: amidase family protein [Scytonema sp. PMC 1069.18]|nr:amidase family protein [Scytonema sp. PMC 1069.18]MEC4882643.1 amidase family protein [Scytonema sp. PMC 1070.18]
MLFSVNIDEIPRIGAMPSTFLLEPPVKFSLREATISDTQKAFIFGALSAEELVQLYLNRIAAYDDVGPAISAVITTNPDALKIARELDATFQSEGFTGELHGIPVLLKDNYDTFDLPTTAGSDVLAGSIPPDDAFTVEQFREAGAIILGKTNMSEFALSSGRLGYSSLGGLTLNPYNLNRDASGSSSGTGAAIAANFAMLGTGTDTSGSVRGPSSFTGLVGIKPTQGLISLDGIIPVAESVDVAGPMARTVTDAAITLGVMAGVDPNDPTTSKSVGKTFEDYTQFLDTEALKGARIGVARDFFGGNDEVDQLVDAAISTMTKLGATVVELNLPDTVVKASNYSTLLNTIVQAEFRPQIEEYLATLDDSYPKTLEELIAASLDPELVNSETPVNPNRIAVYEDSLAFGGLSNPEYIKAITEGVPALENEINSIFATNYLDAIVYPTVATPPTPITTADGSFIDDPTYKVNLENIGGDPYRAGYLATLTGLPDITVPVGFTEAGLPVGMSFFGQEFTEPKLLGFAYAYEQATQVRVPPDNTPTIPGEEFEYLTRVLVTGDAGDDELDTKLLPEFDGNQDVVFAGDGDDLVDTTQSISGGNYVFGGNGQDRLLAGKGDYLYGDAGDDILDASAGRGGNQLYGGDGNDILIGRSNDQLYGDDGDDNLFVGAKGNNVITGGAGADQFWITIPELPDSANIITDFDFREDRLRSLGLSIKDLTFAQDGSDTVISTNGQKIAVLLGTNSFAEYLVN